MMQGGARRREKVERNVERVRVVAALAPERFSLKQDVEGREMIDLGSSREKGWRAGGGAYEACR